MGNLGVDRFALSLMAASARFHGNTDGLLALAQLRPPYFCW